MMKQLKSFNFTDAQRKRLASIILKLDKEKQDILVSGDNIATINGQSLLNGGNISLIKTGIFSIVTELPTNDIDKDKVYLVPSTETDDENKFSEYIYTDNGWEKLGTFTAKIDLSNYVQKTDVVTNTTNGLMLASDKTKLDAFDEVLTGISQQIAEKANNVDIPKSIKFDKYDYNPDILYLSVYNSAKEKLFTDVLYLLDRGTPVSLIITDYHGSIMIKANFNVSSSNKNLLKVDDNGYCSVIIPNATTSKEGLMSKEDKAKLDSQPTIKASDATGVTDDDYVVIKKSELNSILSRLSALENKA